MPGSGLATLDEDQKERDLRGMSVGTRKKKAVCLLGGGFANKGAEAMVLTVAEAIRERLPDVSILMRIANLYFADARANGLIPVKADRPTSAASRLLSKARMARIYLKCGALIDVGGYQFGDAWGEQVAWAKSRAVKRSVQFGNLVFFMPQAWGPFSSKGIVDATRTVIETATLSYVRDETSLAAVEKLAGEGNPKVRFAHDIAWNFQGADPSVGLKLIRDAGLSAKAGSLVVCLTPNVRVYERSEGKGADSGYIRCLRDIVDHLCSEHGVQVVLMGHELRRNNSQVMDDRRLCNYLLSCLDESLPVVHLDEVLTAAQVKSVIGNCDLLLSSRYHALIAALSQGIPSAAIGWSHKYDELMAEVGLSSNIISLSKTSEEIRDDVDLIVQRMDVTRSAIGPKTAAMKESGRQALDEVVSRIEERFRG
ncbi:MAG: polysaccharide pyruvyl transferase family protein [Phycisphaerales bacterium]|nr:MAG: polysaccharide pyruvyl transferase family protein [Phycisphaerales bacterium]